MTLKIKLISNNYYNKYYSDKFRVMSINKTVHTKV